jgi:peroxiredoxin Q/BCP
MAILKVGSKAPNFSLLASDGKTYSLKDFNGKKVVLYFYPKDDTAVCTAEACSFNQNLSAVKSSGAVVLGVSPDGLKSHTKFVSKYDLNFLILSDESKKMLREYGVWQQKSMFGNTYMGVVRTTFVIDEKGKVSHIFPKVRVKGHVEKILKALSE